MKNLIGIPAEGDNFFDRDDIAKRLWRRLDTDNVLLLAPRRVGKTSLLRKMQQTAETHGFFAGYLSVSDLVTEKEFVEALFGAVLDHPQGSGLMTKLIDGPLKGMLRKVQKVSVAGFGLEIAPESVDAWKHIGESFARTLAQLDGRWLIMVDEMPLFVLSLLRGDNGRLRARTFLNWFRELRLDIRFSSEIRWILCGSVGLDSVARRERMGDAINDLAMVSLGPFSEDVADRFLIKLSESYQIPLDDQVRQHIRKRVGWLIPFHIQLLFAELRESCNEDTPPTPELVDNVYESLLKTTNRAYFDWWVQRLHDELGQTEARSAMVLLNTVAQADSATSHDQLQLVLDSVTGANAALSTGESRLNYLLDVLVSDGYLTDENHQYRFRSPLIRDYWRRRVLP